MEKHTNEVLEWNVKQSFSLVIGEIDGPKSFVKWQFKDNRKNTKVKITVYPHLLINWPKFFHIYLTYCISHHKLKLFKGCIARSKTSC